MKVTIEDIRKAKERIKGVVKNTSIDKSFSASKLLGTEVFFKMENEQLTGSFKIRGALNKISSLTPEERQRGVVASSAGNHAKGVAYSAAKVGVSAKIVMPETAPLVKIDATRNYGAEVVLHGAFYDEAFERAQKIQKEEQRIFVHPYQDEAIIAGQGTIGLEIAEVLPDLDSIVVPIGGGGLISGIAVAMKSLNPHIKIFGVQSNLVSTMEQMFHGQTAPQPSAHRLKATIADGIAVKKASPEMHDSFIKKYVDDIVTVTDEEIAEAIFFLIERSKAVVEGSGAASFAAAMAGKLTLGKKTCIVLSGGNIDLNLISKIIDLGLIRKGRLTEISVVVPDVPGLLSEITRVIAAERANILQVHHDRVERGLQLREARIEFLLETTSHEHAEKVRQALMGLGGVRLL